ncbi:MAG TPA: dTMP kinase [Candidatus Eisenbacteria bacterium]|nr:dTMP kinase [Candidatus Eisenbacteria bacterium]
MPGLFVTLEGIEGSGKSTQADRLKGALESEGVAVVRTREPGGTPFAEQIRQLVLNLGEEPVFPETELLLFLAARAQHVRGLIAPALKAGQVVICDRFTDATLAYQGGARNSGIEMVRRLNDWATGGLQPDRTFLIDLPVQEGIARSRKRQGNFGIDRIEREGPGFLEKVRQAYRALADKEPERIRVLDGTESADVLAGIILSDVKSKLVGP